MSHCCPRFNLAHSSGSGGVARCLCRLLNEGQRLAIGAIQITSHPPQRDLSFQLDSLRYRARVTLTGWGGRVAATALADSA